MARRLNKILQRVERIESVSGLMAWTFKDAIRNEREREKERGIDNVDRALTERTSSNDIFPRIRRRFRAPAHDQPADIVLFRVTFAMIYRGEPR